MHSNDWDKLSELDSLRAVIDPNDRKGSKNFLIDLIHWNALRDHLRQSKDVLDYGCGIGRYARRITALGMNYSGIDPSNGMIQKAIALHGEKYFKHFDGKNIPFASESFDTVVLSEVLTYLLKTPCAEIALKEIYRVLKPAGRLIMLEQASISGRKSESVSQIIKESDYTQALSGQFRIERIYKVRSPDFSAFTCRILDSPKVPLMAFKWIAGIVAHHEAALVAKAKEDYFKTTSYYEFLIDAKVDKPSVTAS